MMYWFRVSVLMLLAACWLGALAQPDPNPKPPQPAPLGNPVIVPFPPLAAAPAVEQPVKIVKMVGVIGERFLDMKNPENPLVMSRALWPAGVTSVIGLPYVHALVVQSTGKNQEEAEQNIDDFENLVKLLDQPIPHVLVQMTLVAMKDEQARPFLQRWLIEENQPGEGKHQQEVMPALEQLLRNGTAVRLASPMLVLLNGGKGTLGLPPMAGLTVLRGIDITQLVVRPDGAILLGLTPQGTHPLPGTIFPEIIIDTNTTVIAGDLYLDNAGKDVPPDHAVLFVTVTRLRSYGKRLGNIPGADAFKGMF